MDSFAQTIKDRLDRERKYRSSLFCRGYLVTTAALKCENTYPFYGLWRRLHIGNYDIYVHPEGSVYSAEKDGRAAVLIGHAYDPFSGELREEILLGKLLSAAQRGERAFFDAADELTGVFVLLLFSTDSLLAIQDCGGQRMLYYGTVGPHVVLTSAPQLAADIFDLQWAPEITALLQTKGYYRGSGFLPGNLSPYRELKRLGANCALRIDEKGFSVSRFYPAAQRRELCSEEEKQAALEEMYRIFAGNLALTMKKWPRVGLSLTGGMDSKTTFACAKPFYGSFFCYSFESKDSERLDADAAAKICQAVGVAHHRYRIPSDPAELLDYEFLHQLIEHNTSHLCKLHSNEIRKYIWLRERNDFDVEVKSDMSEVGRAYTERKYYKVRMPRVLAPRHLTISQARYFLEPRASRFADAAYRALMEETGLTDDIFGYSMQDLCYWEVRMSSWAATSFASQEFFHEITIPYNNRRLLDLFLRFPKEDRLQDGPHLRLMRRGNPAVADMDISVKDSYLGKKRMLIETLYYYYATKGNTLGKK